MNKFKSRDSLAQRIFMFEAISELNEKIFVTALGLFLRCRSSACTWFWNKPEQMGTASQSWLTRRGACLATVLVICLGLTVRADDASTEFYRTRIEPVLKSKCFECHSHEAGESNGELMLDSLAGVTSGGTRGAALVPGKPDRSLLLKAISFADSELQMPPDGKLSDEVIQDFRKWISEGALGLPVGSAKQKSGIVRLSEENASSHWAYRPPVAAEPISVVQQLAALPLSERTRWESHFLGSLDPIDQLIRKKLLDAKIDPSPQADRRTLMRRVYYDLVGLPPYAKELVEFEQDPRPTEVVYRELVDRLLASPHFGERWARYWMDVARYADTKGYVFREDREYSQAFRYRDWLIGAFNDGVSYVEFVRAQLAADVHDPENASGDLPALGFLTLGRRFLNNKQDIIDDRLDVTARGLMGLTLACARCHDHKYDPVSQADYYALYGVFLNTEEPGGDPWPHRVADAKEPQKSFILIRGSPGNRGAEVPRRFVRFLSREEQRFEKGSGRDELAQTITRSENPLTARVFVNRVWMRLMGASIVDSPSDFGVRCPAPKQQDVLDQLAVDFMASGWDTKQLIQRLVMTATYRQSSIARTEANKDDVENSLYWRMNRRRMDFESLRDASLAVAGQLDTQVGGASEKIHVTPFSHRRSVYAYIDRQNLPGIFRNFDVASPDSHSPQRLQTTVPQQGLYLMNSQFETSLAKGLGERIQANSSMTLDEKIQTCFLHILGRAPDKDEMESARDFLAVATTPVEQPSEIWICGYGTLDLEGGRLFDFQRLPAFTGTTWQGGREFPDPKFGYLSHNKDGGHPGEGVKFVAVRRWIAPRSGTLSVRGKLVHSSDNGDGVRGTVILNSTEKLGEWQSKKQEPRTDCLSVVVQQGQTIDFVVDALETVSNDSYVWKVRIKYADNGPEFDSSREFPQPVVPPLTAWDQLVQSLMVCNEFAFVD